MTVQRFPWLFFCVFLIAVLLLFLPVAHCQRTNTFFVGQHPGSTLGMKVAAAQRSCSGVTSVPCYIVFEPEMAAFAPVGTLPAKCAQCKWQDYSGKFGGLDVGGGKNFGSSAEVQLKTADSATTGVFLNLMQPSTFFLGSGVRWESTVWRYKSANGAMIVGGPDGITFGTFNGKTVNATTAALDAAALLVDNKNRALVNAPSAPSAVANWHSLSGTWHEDFCKVTPEEVLPAAGTMGVTTAQRSYYSDGVSGSWVVKASTDFGGCGALLDHLNTNETRAWLYYEGVDIFPAVGTAAHLYSSTVKLGSVANGTAYWVALCGTALPNDDGSGCMEYGGGLQLPGILVGVTNGASAGTWHLVGYGTEKSANVDSGVTATTDEVTFDVYYTAAKISLFVNGSEVAAITNTAHVPAVRLTPLWGYHNPNGASATLAIARAAYY